MVENHSWNLYYVRTFYQPFKQEAEMVMSVMEANVPPAKWEELKSAFRHATEIIPPQIRETILVQSIDDPRIWRILTCWHTKRHVTVIQDEFLKCGAAEIFRSIGIEPTQGLFNIMVSAREPDLGSDMTETPLSDMLLAMEEDTV
jgi:hypothetical protein